MTTTLAGAAGALGAMTTVWIRTGKPDVAMTGNGLLAGLVGITAGCRGRHRPYAVLIIGVLAGILVVFAVEFFDKVVKVDDPVGRHLGPRRVRCCSAPSAWACSPARTSRASGAGPAARRRGRPARSASSSASSRWRPGCRCARWHLFYGLKHTIGLRVGEDEELAGLDVHEHGSPGYGEGFGSFTLDSPISNGETTTEDEPVPA